MEHTTQFGLNSKLILANISYTEFQFIANSTFTLLNACRGRKYMKTILGAMSLFLTIGLSQPCFAYLQSDMEKLAPPVGGFAFLKGYNSINGTYSDVCLRPVNASETGVDPTGIFNYEYVRSASQAASFRDFDISASLAINGIVAGGSVSTEVNYFRENRSTMENGAVSVYYYDAIAPQFVSASGSFILNEKGISALQRAERKGDFREFRKTCGDYVVVGKQEARYMYGNLFFENSTSYSNTEVDTKVDVAARYLMSSLEASFKNSTGDESYEEDERLKITFATSGNIQAPSPVGVESFASAAAAFSNEPVEDTKTLSNIFVVPYEKLLSDNQFYADIPERQRQKIKTIINGISLIELARNEARYMQRRESNSVEKAKLNDTRERLYRQLVHTRKILSQENGCRKDFNRACKNLFAQFQNYPENLNQSGLQRFISAAKRTNGKCAKGYVITRPDGRQTCQPCDMGKQPNFQKNNEGKCLYMPETRPSKSDKRLFMDDMRTQQTSSELILINYPDICKRKGKACGKKAADQICFDNRLGHSTSFKVWKPTLRSYIPKTVYRNGSACFTDSGSFNPNQCRAFHYIDCKKTPSATGTLSIAQD
ncbi:MAG: hypothetical protein AAGJ93_10545 [Bacteroidota bacterium]